MINALKKITIGAPIQTFVKPIEAIEAITNKPSPPIHANPNPPSTDPIPPPCPNQTMNPTQLQCKPWTRKRDVRWEKEWGLRERGTLQKKKYHHHDLATPRSTTAHREKQGVGDEETKWEWGREDWKTQKIKREKKTDGIKKLIFFFRIVVQCNSKNRIAL